MFKKIKFLDVQLTLSAGINAKFYRALDDSNEELSD